MLTCGCAPQLRYVQVDFAQPLDYVEPPRQPPPQQAPAAASGQAAAGGAGGAAGSAAAEPAAQEPEEPKFLAFAGTGRRLDGKAAGPSNPVAIPVPGVGRASAAPPGNDSAASGSAPKTGWYAGQRRLRCLEGSKL